MLRASGEGAAPTKQTTLTHIEREANATATSVKVASFERGGCPRRGTGRGLANEHAEASDPADGHGVGVGVGKGTGSGGEGRSCVGGRKGASVVKGTAKGISPSPPLLIEVH